MGHGSILIVEPRRRTLRSCSLQVCRCESNIRSFNKLRSDKYRGKLANRGRVLRDRQSFGCEISVIADVYVRRVSTTGIRAAVFWSKLGRGLARGSEDAEQGTDP